MQYILYILIKISQHFMCYHLFSVRWVAAWAACLRVVSNNGMLPRCTTSTFITTTLSIPWGLCRLTADLAGRPSRQPTLTLCRVTGLHFRGVHREQVRSVTYSDMTDMDDNEDFFSQVFCHPVCQCQRILILPPTTGLGCSESAAASVTIKYTTIL